MNDFRCHTLFNLNAFKLNFFIVPKYSTLMHSNRLFYTTQSEYIQIEYLPTVMKVRVGYSTAAPPQSNSDDSSEDGMLGSASRDSLPEEAGDDVDVTTLRDSNIVPDTTLVF
jgi:hypothetical protein